MSSGPGQFFRNLFSFKDGGAIPPSNAMERVGTGFPSTRRYAKPPGVPRISADDARALFGKLIARPVPKKKGGAVKKRKAKPKKAKK